MIDRESTLANSEIVQLLKSKCVNVALDQAYQRRQRDAEGVFYRKIATQGPRNDMRGTTQGFYVAAPDGKLLGYTNHRSPDRVLQTLKSALEKYAPADTRVIQQGRPDPWWSVPRPSDAVVVRVHTKVLGGYRKSTQLAGNELASRAREIFQSALARDNLWVTAREVTELKAGRVPKSLQQRIARFHLVDNTRGEPPMWQQNEIVSSEFTVDPSGRVTGRVHLKTNNREREFRADVLGFVKFQGDRLSRFDLVANGSFRGEGRYTRGAPSGEFPLAVSFMLADGQDIADDVKPQGIKGVGHSGYLAQ